MTRTPMNAVDPAGRNPGTIPLFVVLLCWLPAAPSANAADRFDPPAVDRSAPAVFTLPPGFQPPDRGAAGLGIRRYAGVALPAHGKTHPIYITEALTGVLTRDPLKAGDVVLAVDGKALGPDPVRQFRDTATRESRESGMMWVSRWRGGEIGQVMIDLGTRPLDLTRGGSHSPDHETMEFDR